MEQLVDQMKVVVADTMCMYLKAHAFHWNVTGPNFHQFHGLFGDIYYEVFGAIDAAAEEIRALGAFAPGTMARFLELTTIEEDANIPSSLEMVAKLKSANDKVITTLKKARDLAEIQDIPGLVNFLEDRLDKHAKHGWMLSATLK